MFFNLILKPLLNESLKATQKNSPSECNGAKGIKKTEPSVESLTNGVANKSSKKKKSKSEKSDKPDKPDKTSQKPATACKSSSKDSTQPEEPLKNPSQTTTTSEKIEVDQPLPPPSKWDNDDFYAEKFEPDLKQNMLNKLQKATATIKSIKAASLLTEDTKSTSNICKN